jgi:hypothetical protein
MARNRKPAAGGPAEKKEVVITVDRRLLYVVGLIAAFGIALAAGMAVTKRGPGQGAQVPEAAATVDQAGAGQQVGAEPVIQVDEAAARATAAAAMGADPEKVVVVDPNIMKPASPEEVPGSGSQDEILVPSDQDAARARITPVSPLQEELLKTPDVTVIEYPDDPTAQAEQALRYKDNEVLSNLEDPNVSDPQYSPLRLETISKPQRGPRLAISDLNLRNTYNFGKIAPDARVSHAFIAKNVGDEDLMISRIYTGCGCTATTVGDEVIPPDGFLKEVITLKPGESIEFVVEFDAAAEGRVGAMSKYVQIFTNDPTKAVFDDDEPLSHETRFRLVVEPSYDVPSGGSEG